MHLSSLLFIYTCSYLFLTLDISNMHLLYIFYYSVSVISGPGSGRFIAAGGSGANEAKVFDHKNGNSVVGKCLFSLF